MDSRVVLDALSPTLPTFLREASHSPAPPARPHPSLQPSLRRSLKAHFRPPRAPAAPRLPSVRVSTLPELQRAVLHARHHRLRVRVSTSGRDAPAAPHPPPGLVIDVSPLNNLVFHPARSVLVAQPAVSLADIAAAAAAHGFSQRVHVPLTARATTVAAALATGAVGAGGPSEGLLADAVAEISLVDACGRLRVYSARDVTGLFQAVKLSLGLFGVIYDVTINVDRFRRVAQVSNRFVPLPALVGGTVPAVLRRLVEKRAGVELTWLPFNSYCRTRTEWTPDTDVVWMRTLERIVEGPDKPRVQLDDDDDVAFRFRTIPQWFSLNAPKLAEQGYAEYRPEHAKLFLGLGFEQTAWKLESKPFAQKVAHAVQYHDNAEVFPVVSVAVAFPLRPAKDEDWATVQKAWRIVTGRAKECDKHGEYPLNVALRTNFVKASDALLAPNFAISAPGKKNACSAIVEIISAKYTNGWENFAKHVVTEWMRLPGARCRLSSDLAAVCDVDTVVASLGESLQSFRSLRKNAGVDDVGMFLDEPFGELLGMTGQLSDFTSSPVSSSGSGRSHIRLKEMESLLGCRSGIEGGPDEIANGDTTATYREDAIGRTSAAVISQTSQSWTPQSSTTALFLPSPTRSRTSLFDENDDHCEEGYKRDKDGFDYDFDDGESIDFDEDGDIIPVAVYRRLPARRKKVVKYQSPLTSPECSLLLGYIALYALLWLALFGGLAARQLGWIS